MRRIRSSEWREERRERRWRGEGRRIRSGEREEEEEEEERRCRVEEGKVSTEGQGH